MRDVIPVVPLPPPKATTSVSASSIQVGKLVPPLDRIRLFSPGEWEDFILEWADSLRNKYARVDRCGGAGDMGRDVIAIHKGNPAHWDNYQCKHYKDLLAPTHIWIEIGKLVYYTYGQKYVYPHRYHFVTPLGVGTKLSNLLRDHAKLKQGLIDNWEEHCQDKITTTAQVKLDLKLRAYIDSLDFSIFESVSPLQIIKEHSATRWHVYRFGGGLPPRPHAVLPPASPAPIETIYTRQLLEAYSDCLKRPVAKIEDISDEAEMRSHYSRSRVEFYRAESLRMFSRDTLPPGEYDILQDEVFYGIADELNSSHTDGYQCVLSVVKLAKSLQLTAHALVICLTMHDRGGICHQLANDERIQWVRKP